MSEGNFSKELDKSINIKELSLYQCYMTLMKNLLFPREHYDSNFKPPPIFKQLENTFASQEKFDELKESFRKIFDRTEGKNLISKKEKEVIIRWYGLMNGRPYYEIYEDSAYKKIAEELNIESKWYPKSVATAKILNRACEKLAKPENFNLLPEEAKNLARL